MTFQHSMSVEVQFLPGVSIASMLLAFKPLADECGWSDDDILAGDLGGDDSISILSSEGKIQHLILSTSGQVTGSYPAVVEAFARNLDVIAEPGYITFRDHDHVDLERAISTIWFGEADAVAAAKRLHAWYLAEELMRSVDVPDAVLRMMAALGKFTPDAPPSDVSVAGVASATCFMDELLDSVSSLTELAEEHGVRTLADIMYLQQAILKGGFIDHYPEESMVLDVVRALPSANVWISFIKVEYMASSFVAAV